MKKTEVIYDDLGFVSEYRCPYCGEMLSEDDSYKDDIGTMFFTCKKCGETSSLVKSEERIRLEKSLKEQNLKPQFFFTVGKKSIKVVFDEDLKTIHPAIDFLDGIAYVGVVLPCVVTDSKGREKRTFKRFFVTSHGELIPMNEEDLKEKGLRLAMLPRGLTCRWSSKSVKAFLDGSLNFDPYEVYIAVKTIIEQFIELPHPDGYDFITIWSIGTYFFIIFATYPYLYIYGCKGVGKSKLGECLAKICFNGKSSVSISTAGLFRTVALLRSTLVMDEEERMSKGERFQEFRAILNSGYKRGETVTRVNPNTFMLEEFQVYSPKAVINIKGLEEVTEDRVIPQVMLRGKNPKVLNVDIPAEGDLWQAIRDRLYTFYLLYANEIAGILPEVERLILERGHLKGRTAELWKPILTLAKFFDKYEKGLFERIYSYALETLNIKIIHEEVENPDMVLIQTLLEIVEADGYYAIKQIKEAMASKYEDEAKWITERWLGSALRRLGFNIKRRRPAYQYLLTVEKVKELAERYNVTIERSERCERSERSEGGSVEKAKATIPEVEEQLRNELTYPFDDGKAIMLISKLRSCDPIEATKIFGKFVEEGKLAKNPYGLWEWTKGLSQSEPRGEV